jgi:hypothetical protein
MQSLYSNSPLVLYRRCLKTNSLILHDRCFGATRVAFAQPTGPPECLNIVGEDVTTVLELPEEDATANSNEADGQVVTNSPSYYNHSFWHKSNGRTLLVIALRRIGLEAT